ncbi:MAG: cation transporter, partial [Candidatus Paceibacterota bacterium]
MKTHTFHITGMHCKACIALSESELLDIPEVREAKASLEDHTVIVTGDFGDKAPREVLEALAPALAPHGYSLSLERQRHHVGWSDFKTALPISIAFVALFIVLQKLGLVNLITTSEVGYGTAFVIGIVASVSTCMAVVGGLVLSMSA